MLKEKRGATAHLETIIAFSIFLIFISFTFMILKPSNQPSTALRSAMIQGTYNQFMENNSISYTKIFLKENSTNGCFSLNLSNITDLVEPTHKVIVLDASNPLLTQVSSDYSYPTLKMNSPGNTNYFYYVLTSKEFIEQSGAIACPHTLTKENYAIGSIENREILSNKTLNELQKTYEENYEILKKQYNIPTQFDISIISKDYISLKKEIPENIEVMAKTYNEEVLFENGTIEYKDFTIKIW